MINLTKIASLPNVYILGKRDRDVLPQYLKNADVGVIPWKRGQFTDYAHPNKLYEYMACGLPVVSTRWEELEYIKSPAYLASNHEEFVELLLEASGEKDRRKYIEFAKANSWEHRFEALMKAVDSDTGA
jgi:glycosyltransferase involved in cell wall biosynthesis